MNNLEPTSRVTVHGYRLSDVEHITKRILDIFEQAIASEIRPNTREPFRNGFHCRIYIKEREEIGAQ